MDAKEFSEKLRAAVKVALSELADESGANEVELIEYDFHGTPQAFMDDLTLKTIEGFRIFEIKQKHPRKYRVKLLRASDWNEFEDHFSPVENDD